MTLSTSAVARLAQARSRFGQRIEYGFEIERRAADDLEHVGGGGLLLQRLPQLVEKAGVLDGDDGLGGEALNQFDLLVTERARLSADRNDAKYCFFLKQRDCEHRSHAIFHKNGP